MTPNLLPSVPMFPKLQSSAQRSPSLSSLTDPIENELSPGPHRNEATRFGSVVALKQLMAPNGKPVLLIRQALDPTPPLKIRSKFPPDVLETLLVPV